jgi:hypothetical protein
MRASVDDAARNPPRGDPPEPRVLVVSQRGRYPAVSRSLRYEFEDSSYGVADIIAPGPFGTHWRLVHRASVALDGLRPGLSAALSGSRFSARRRYDLVLVVVQTMADLLRLQPLRALLRQARTSACLVDELFVNGFHQRRGEIRLLSMFDRILLTMEGSVPAVAEATLRPTSYFAPSVDALESCPYPNGPPRVIDVLSIGRQSPMTHSALLDHSRRLGWLYLYDGGSGDTGTPDHRSHRRRTVDLLRHTRYFLCYHGKIDRPEETGGQQEIGFRYFEGAAAGAINLGEAPSAPSYSRLFGWTDSVVPLPFGSAEVESSLRSFEADPSRCEGIRRASVRHSLLLHDHVYRWADVLRLAELPEPEEMALRRRLLSERAAAVKAMES